jgi:hypothetical protein
VHAGVEHRRWHVDRAGQRSRPRVGADLQEHRRLLAPAGGYDPRFGVKAVAQLLGHPGRRLEHELAPAARARHFIGDAELELQLVAPRHARDALLDAHAGAGCVDELDALGRAVGGAQHTHRPQRLLQWIGRQLLAGGAGGEHE